MTVSPPYGYGSLGLPPRVPADATLEYDIEILAAEPPVRVRLCV